ncbi:MAG: hypothetical protein Tsb0020_47830 [Haliangiales bacterium]
MERLGEAAQRVDVEPRAVARADLRQVAPEHDHRADLAGGHRFTQRRRRLCTVKAEPEQLANIASELIERSHRASVDGGAERRQVRAESSDRKNICALGYPSYKGLKKKTARIQCELRAKPAQAVRSRC